MNETWLLTLLAQGRNRDDDLDAGDDETVYRCRARLLTVVTVEAATAVVARAVARAGGDLAAVVDAWHARTPNPVTRAVSQSQGHGLLARSADVLPALRPRVAALPRSVASGVIAAEVDLDAESLARIIGYDDVQAALAGSRPAAAHVWTQALLPDIRAMAAQVAHLTDPLRIPATGADLHAAFAIR